MSDMTTPSQTSGPLFGFALLFPGCQEALPVSAAEAVTIEGRLFDGSGMPVQWEGFVEFWTGDLFARDRAATGGKYRVVMGRPALRPGAGAAPHLNVIVFARGLNKHVHTRMYFPDEAEANAADPLLASLPPERRRTLLAAASDDPRRLTFDIHLQGENETVFLDIEHPAR